MDYDTLDSIADSYIPLLAVTLAARLIGRAARKPADRKLDARAYAYSMGLLLTFYGILFLDNLIHIWPSLGLDYSTHIAVALALALPICALSHRLQKAVACSFAFYVFLGRLWKTQPNCGTMRS